MVTKTKWPQIIANIFKPSLGKNKNHQKEAEAGKTLQKFESGADEDAA